MEGRAVYLRQGKFGITNMRKRARCDPPPQVSSDDGSSWKIQVSAIKFSDSPSALSELTFTLRSLYSLLFRSVPARNAGLNVAFPLVINRDAQK